MLRKIVNFIQKHHMIENGDTIIMGVSGGADSVCLLIVLKRLQVEMNLHLQVVHINHGIREEAKEDALFVQKLCAQYDIPCKMVDVKVKELARIEHISEEEAGRKARYDAFQAAFMELQGEKKATAKIAVAHNKNDGVETTLFHLFRGSGLRGLSGIQPVRDNIIRPLLGVERKEIEAFLQENSIEFCIDATNAQNIYTRNKIRNQILPYVIEEINANALTHVEETAQLAKEAEEYIEKQAKKEMPSILRKESKTEIYLEVEKLLEYDEIIQKYVIRECVIKLAQSRKDITLQHMKEVLALFEKPVGKMIMLPYGINAKRTYTEVVLFTEEMVVKEEFCEKIITIPGIYPLAMQESMEVTLLEADEKRIIPQNQYTKWFDYDKIGKSLKLRHRMIGDYLTINDKLEKQSLKSYMINQKIPKEERDMQLLLADENHILWVIGQRISQYYKVSENTKTILQIQIKK